MSRIERLLFNEAGKIFSKVIDSSLERVDHNTDIQIVHYKHRMAKDVCKKVHSLKQFTPEYDIMFNNIVSEDQMLSDCSIIRCIVLNAFYSTRGVR